MFLKGRSSERQGLMKALYGADTLAARISSIRMSGHLQRNRFCRTSHW